MFNGENFSQILSYNGSLVRISGRVDTVEDLPAQGSFNQMYLVGLADAESFDKYLWDIPTQDWINKGTSSLFDINSKVDVAPGKGLSDTNFTQLEKTKLSGVANNANNYTHPATHGVSMIVESSSKRFVSDAEKLYWENKADPYMAGDCIGIKNNIISSIPAVVLIMKDQNGYYMREDGLGNHRLCCSPKGYFAFPLNATITIGGNE